MAYDEELAKYERRVEQLEDVLRRIRSWCEAYPVDVFPEPDYAASRKALEDAGLSLDRISADCMRHVVTKIGEMIVAAGV